MSPESHSPALCQVDQALLTRGTVVEPEALHGSEHGLSGQISEPHLKPTSLTWAHPALVSGVRPTFSTHGEAGPTYQGIKDKRVIDIRVRILHHDGEQSIQCVLEELGETRGL